MTMHFQTTRRYFLGLVLIGLMPSAWSQQDAAFEITAPEAWSRMQSGKISLIDIRTPTEWQQTGVAKGAKKAEWQNAKGLPGFADDVLKLVAGNKAAPIALICRTGNRSTQAQKYLQEQGFTNVFNVKEGMMGSNAGPGWLKRGLAVQ